MTLTQEQLRAAARKLCELRLVDPDVFPGGWDSNEGLAAREIEEFLGIQEAIAFGIAAHPDGGAQ